MADPPSSASRPQSQAIVNQPENALRLNAATLAKQIAALTAKADQIMLLKAVQHSARQKRNLVPVLEAGLWTTLCSWLGKAVETGSDEVAFHCLETVSAVPYTIDMLLKSDMGKLTKRITTKLKPKFPKADPLAQRIMNDIVALAMQQSQLGSAPQAVPSTASQAATAAGGSSAARPAAGGRGPSPGPHPAGPPGPVPAQHATLPSSVQAAAAPTKPVRPASPPKAVPRSNSNNSDSEPPAKRRPSSEDAGVTPSSAATSGPPRRPSTSPPAEKIQFDDNFLNALSGSNAANKAMKRPASLLNPNRAGATASAPEAASRAPGTLAASSSMAAASRPRPAERRQVAVLDSAEAVDRRRRRPSSEAVKPPLPEGELAGASETVPTEASGPAADTTSLSSSTAKAVPSGTADAGHAGAIPDAAVASATSSAGKKSNLAGKIKRKLSVTWRPNDQLEEIRTYELDEEERLDKNRAFASIGLPEQEGSGLTRIVEVIAWSPPLPLRISEPPVQVDSQEREIQARRHDSLMRAIDTPPTPREPEAEADRVANEAVPPKLVPLTETTDSAPLLTTDELANISAILQQVPTSKPASTLALPEGLYLPPATAAATYATGGPAPPYAGPTSRMYPLTGDVPAASISAAPLPTALPWASTVASPATSFASTAAAGPGPGSYASMQPDLAVPGGVPASYPPHTSLPPMSMANHLAAPPSASQSPLYPDPVAAHPPLTGTGPSFAGAPVPAPPAAPPYWQAERRQEDARGWRNDDSRAPPPQDYRSDPHRSDPHRGDPHRGDPYRSDPYRGDRSRDRSGSSPQDDYHSRDRSSDRRGDGFSDRERDRRARTPCHYFNTPRGCRNGDQCPFLHELHK